MKGTMFAFPNGPPILRREFDAAFIHLLSFVASKRACSKVTGSILGQPLRQLYEVSDAFTKYIR